MPILLQSKSIIGTAVNIQSASIKSLILSILKLGL